MDCRNALPRQLLGPDQPRSDRARGLDVRVQTHVGSIVLTRRAAPPRLRSSGASLWRNARASRRASGGEVLPRLTRSAPGRRLRIQAQVGEDLLDHRPLEDGGDDLELPGGPMLPPTTSGWLISISTRS